MVNVTLEWPASSQFTYTNFGAWFGHQNTGSQTINRIGMFAYGVPTAPGDIPLVGTASYAGELRGASSQWGWQNLSGTVAMDFDFASGSLGGKMDMIYEDYYSLYAIPTMPFHETVFAKGSTTFSGNFDTVGLSTNTHFNGQFTGPNAAELMANFSGRLTIPQTGVATDIAGVWIAAKQ
jgi:hypothetical protein